MAAVTSFVVEENDLQPLPDDGDTATIRVAFDVANGCERLEQRVIRFGPGRSAPAGRPAGPRSGGRGAVLPSSM